MSSGTDWSGTSSGRTTRTDGPAGPRAPRPAPAPASPRPNRGWFHATRAAIGVGLATLTYVLFPATPAERVPVYDVGAVAASNVIAPFAFSVPKAPGELARERAELERAAEPIFVFSPADLDSSRIELQRFAAAVAAGANSPDPARAIEGVRGAAAAFQVRLTPDEAAFLARPEQRAAIVGAVGRVYDRWASAGVAPSGVLDSVRGDVIVRSASGERRVRADDVMTFSALVSRARQIHPAPASPAGDAVYLRVLGAFFRPTLRPDPTATRLRIDELVQSVDRNRFEIRAGEKIVGANEVVSPEDHDKLRTLASTLASRPGRERGIGRALGGILLNFVILAVLGVVLAMFRPEVYENVRFIGLFAAVIALVLIAAAVVASTTPVRPELVPVAFAAVILSALFDQRISLITAMVLALLLGTQNAYRGTNLLTTALLAGTVAAFTVRAINRRNQSFRWISAVAAAYAVAAIALGGALNTPFPEILQSIGWGALSAVVSVVFALQLLPVAEHFTGIETDLTLLEWSDLNRPLMQRLSLEAPGTYAHTIQMANLAEAACRAIGANALLARVGCYYHDIGKLAKPQYFVENQRKGQNPHDKLKPGTSASIIRNHIREGLELAAQHGVPRAVRAFIAEHHGTGAISYFFERAKEREGGANPNEFAYPGPRPQSAETAVAMLADGVEAAVRVLSEPRPERVREVVEHIVRQRMEQGQLRDAPLTLRQLDIVKDEFTRVLSGMYHNRIDYPAASGGVTSEFASA